MDDLESNSNSSLKTKELLKKLNVMQASKENKVELDKIGKQDVLARLLFVDVTKGLSSQQVVDNRVAFGDNVMPEIPMKSFCALFIASFNDFVLIVLIIAAVISLILGVFGPEASQNPHAWIEGAAIMAAVFIVATVSAGNDYAKELQFRELAKFAQTMESCCVYRDGSRKTLHPKEIVVGDVLSVRGGDQCFADAVLFKCDEKLGVTMDEAALTGESELVKKTSQGDPFLLSSTVCASHGNAEDCKAIVIGVGEFSQWGIISANLDQEDVNTPLQDKLEDMVVVIGYFGAICAILTFGITLLYIGIREPTTEEWIGGIIDAFIIAITIIVVAIPEGLPLAVTISLAYSMKKMTLNNNLVKTLQACETMGNATNICSDKTGTLTEGRMALVEGWFGDHFVREAEFDTFFKDFKDDKCLGKNSWQKSSNPEWLEPLLQNIGINSSGEVTYGFTYFAPPRDKEPVCLPWLADETLCSTRIPEAWGAERGKESNFIQVMKDRPEHSNMTELAMLTFAHKLDFNTMSAKKELNVVKVIPFDFKKIRSSAIIGLENGMYRVLVKGAPEYMIKFCAFYATNTGAPTKLNTMKLDELMKAQDEMTIGQKRVICLAHKDVESSSLSKSPSEMNEEELDDLCTSELIIDAFVGIIDPLRADVPASVAVAQSAGVKVRMVTGDNLKTATAIAKKAGIFKTGDIALEGPDFRKLSPSQLDDIMPKLTVVARSAPEDKLLIVTRLNGKNIPNTKEEWELAHPGRDYDTEKDLLLPGYRSEWDLKHPGGGDVVGVTGDGTNDAPALKAADVGLAMNSGTSVAKEASDIVILDDSFSSIVSSIKWGRCVYDNIRKFLQFQLTVNVVALFLVFIGALIGLEDPPLNAVQMLWVNLIMDTLGALALGTEQPTDELLLRPPYKRDAYLVNRPMIRNILAQSFYQLCLLLFILIFGAKLLHVEEGNTCGEYKSTPYHDHTAWDWSLKGNYKGKEKGDVGCDTFLNGLLKDGSTAESVGYGNLDCSHDRSYSCLHDNYDHFDEDFETKCLVCKEFNFVHFTIIFNAFVFCQIFNEFNARSITDEWRVLSGLQNNRIFIGVIVLTVSLQILIVEFGGLFTKTSPLSMKQWFVTVLLGFGSLPIGTLMRFIPISENPNNFATNPNSIN